MCAPQVRHMHGPLWEIRLIGRDGIARALYVAAAGERVLIVRVFSKKTQKAPPAEIEIALSAAREFLEWIEAG
jgi:phage-related protein